MSLATDFNKSAERFPFKANVNFMAFCSVSPLSRPAADRAMKCLERQVQVGRGMIFEYAGEEHIASRFHRNFAALLQTSAENISMTTNTSEAISMIANGYPFEAGDQVISYVNEYPANHYPWRLQERRGVELIELSDVDPLQEKRDYTRPIPAEFARSWSFEELESKITPRTRVIAISHVQFTSGFTADLERLGSFCREKGIDLVVDAAQSLGCLPVHPEKWGVSALASAGWKWLMGPVGTGVMYSSPAFREKIQVTMSGADQMVQDTQYLDHTWNPHSDGRKFEYSTVTYSALDGISTGVEELFLPHSMEAIRDHNFALQEIAIEALDLGKFQPVVHLPEHRSGILSLIPLAGNAKQISTALEAQGVIITPRDGYLRFAPHLCSTQEEVIAAIEALNAVT
ncbi:MAG: aminotransferase class V-fold PLP-dependent enzyme [Planctomycetota bacterium]